ncbi:MAG TPA: helix-turn-helix domain-containing protein [Solirubrobacterales bacterium]|nr:helix-turn-helix domain-containing protein [Solirubrobacterales bacterium]
MDLPAPVEGALAQPTRARIFAFLVERRAPADTQEIAARFGLHPNGIRLHLERLEEGGFVVRSRERGGAGRPRDIWTVSPQAHPGGTPPRAYADLANWLARAIPTTPSRLREVELAGREIGAELAPSPGTDAVAGFRDALAALGFEPTLERDEGGFSCRLGNCPYSNAVAQNQEIVCGLHRGITAGILAALAPGAELTRFEPVDPERAGCTVEVRT